MYCEWAADARVKKAGARPSRAAGGKTALVWNLDPTLVRFLDLVQGNQSNFGNHGGAVTSLSRRNVLRGEGEFAEAETMTRSFGVISSRISGATCRPSTYQSRFGCRRAAL